MAQGSVEALHGNTNSGRWEVCRNFYLIPWYSVGY